MRENRDNKNIFKRETVEKKLEEPKVVQQMTSQVVEQKEVKETIESIITSVKGVVTGCDMLNVRSKPDKESDVVSMLQRDVEIEILDENASDNFYKVVTEIGIEGYCMKKFIAIKAEV